MFICLQVPTSGDIQSRGPSREPGLGPGGPGRQHVVELEVLDQEAAADVKSSLSFVLRLIGGNTKTKLEWRSDSENLDGLGSRFKFGARVVPKDSRKWKREQTRRQRHCCRHRPSRRSTRAPSESVLRDQSWVATTNHNRDQRHGRLQIGRAHV